MTTVLAAFITQLPACAGASANVWTGLFQITPESAEILALGKLPCKTDARSQRRNGLHRGNKARDGL